MLETVFRLSVGDNNSVWETVLAKVTLWNNSTQGLSENLDHYDLKVPVAISCTYYFNFFN